MFSSAKIGRWNNNLTTRISIMENKEITSTFTGKNSSSDRIFYVN